ncbi:glycosyltransferase [Pannonibacter indicus]|uniref:glycosyltransferase n=1 Tax=Pannonibacter indicus TaxID=466044 RepID=UPI00391B9F8F
MSAAPVISFVTPCYNRSSFLVRCIESIPEAFHGQVEHIIVDGGSTDGSIDLIRSYAHVRLLSEPDEGLYDAANKGIRMAQGQYVGFLATDDFIAPSFFNQFLRQDGEWTSCAPVLTFDFLNHTGETQRRCPAFPFNLESIFHGRTPLFSMLVRRDILTDLGGFDTSYKIAGDFELTLRLARLGVEALASPYLMQNFWMHEGSLTGHSGAARDREYGEIIQIIAASYPFLVFKSGFLGAAREKTADVARYFYRTKGLKSLLSNWRLMTLIVAMGIDFR